MHNFTQNTDVKVELFILAQTGSYQVQGIRPFKTHVGPNLISQLEEVTRGGQRLGASTVDMIAGQLIHPASDVEGHAVIPEGWNSRRYRFLMRVSEQHPFTPGSRTIRVFFGYTDHSDSSYGKLIDPNMRIYFNSETTLDESTQVLQNGPTRIVRPLSANQIITNARIANAATRGVSGGDTTFGYMIRPEDVFAIRETQIHAAIAASVVPNGIDSSYNYNSVATTDNFQLSRRRDNSPTRYVSDTLTGMQRALSDADLHGVNPNDASLYSEAASNLRNHSTKTDLFLARLATHGGYTQRGYITMSELASIFPEVGSEYVTKHSYDDGRSIRKVNHAHDSETWMGAAPIDIAASLIAQVIPAIMMENMFRNIAFQVTTSMMPGEYSFQWNPGALRSVVDGLNVMSLLPTMEHRVAVDALNAITHRGQINFMISVMADLSGDTIIDISLGGSPVTRYVAPTFADSLFTPLVSSVQDAANNVSKDMIYVTSEILQDQESQRVNFMGNQNHFTFNQGTTSNALTDLL